MTWEKTLLDASFRGVPFPVAEVSDEEGKTVAVFQVPYTNGGAVEDMGNDPHGFDIRAHFWGDDYEAAMSRLLEALRVTGPGELVHPVFGAMNVQALKWRIEHDAENVDACLVVMRFVEVNLTATVFELAAASSAADRVAERGQAARDASASSAATVVTRAASSGLPRLPQITQAFGAIKSQLRQLVDTRGIKLLLSDLDPIIYPRAALNDLQVIVDQALAGLPLGGLNGQFTGAFNGRSSALAMADFDALLRAQPATVLVQTSSSDANDVAVAANLTAHARILNATTVATAAAIILAAEVEFAELDRAEIERLAGTARAAIQAAILAARSALDSLSGAQAVQALSQVADDIQEAARTAIEQRPPVVKRAVPVGGHPRLIAHAMYGDQARATELVRLNRWGREVFIDAGREVLAYAK